MIKLLLKFIITIISIFALLLTIGFSADTGTGLEIAGKIILILSLFALFQYVVWRSEMTSASKNTKRWLIGTIIVITILLALLGLSQV